MPVSGLLYFGRGCIMVAGGGTEAVTAWTIHALRMEYQVTLISFSKIDLDTLDRFYGTELSQETCSVIQPGLPPFLARTHRFSVLKDHLMMRYCKSVQKKYDLFISTGGGVDFGRRSIQYYGLAPGSNLIKVLSGSRDLPGWYRLVKRSFVRGCAALSGYSETNMLQNATLVTSKWAGEAISAAQGFANFQVVYPPVRDQSSETPWGGRQPTFLCISRIVPEKGVHRTIEITRRVRERGFDISLVIVGRIDDASYGRKIVRLAQENPWVTLSEPLEREDLQRLMDRCQYGINAALDEPFGLAVAEMVKAGCIVFVPNGGGQIEIVEAKELTYNDTEDAVSKIISVLSSESLRKALALKLAQQANIFSTESFCQSIQSVTQEVLDSL
jgi:glycosyltransferase involved in cell wall biosynthesis